MSRMSNLEPLVLNALVNDDRCKKDDFILYLSVIEQMGIDTNITINSVLKNHKNFNLPSFESVSRCRRKLQERDVSLKSDEAVRIREKERREFEDYAMGDKVWY